MIKCEVLYPTDRCLHLDLWHGVNRLKGHPRSEVVLRWLAALPALTTLETQPTSCGVDPLPLHGALVSLRSLGRS